MHRIHKGYLAGPASRQHRLTNGPTQLERRRGTHRPQRTTFLTPSQVGEKVDALHRVAHVDEGVETTRNAHAFATSRARGYATGAKGRHRGDSALLGGVGGTI